MQACCEKTRFTIVLAVLILCLAVTPVLGFPGNDTTTDGSEGLASDVEVLETMSSGGYTYVRVRSGEEEIWAAGPKRAVAVGDRISLPTGMLMTSFHSQSLNRTFEAIYFVGAIEVLCDADAAAQVTARGDHGGATAPTAVEVGSLEKPEGGSTIADLFAERVEVSGKQVLVRGRVVKFNAGIMGRNWIHIQDGTGEAGSNDLTITTDATVKLGDVVLVRGKAVTDKDFGAGYQYELVIEEATVEVE
jgi:hypothetical protein